MASRRTRLSLEQAQRLHQRKLADASSTNPELQLIWFNSMKLAFKEMDDVFKLTQSADGFEFLDIGCCPGGFSSYILEANPKAIGTGISLEVSQGGHEYLLEEHLRSRFELIWADVTKYRLGPLCTNAATYTPLPFSHLSHPNGFALVLLDGHALRNTAGPSLSALHTLADRLLISQLIIAFDVIRAGGTIVMKLNDIRNPTTKRLLYLFDALAADVRTWKPVCIHATRPTFYIIARGIRCGPSAHSFGSVQEELQALWARLTMGQTMDGDSLNFIVDGHTLKTTYARRLSELTNHIHVVQAQASEGQRKQVAMGF
ncbi:hypothetical protein PENSPDRAFT_669002 [Peniophora sp. CONT]|nr:hypothetical protein PENSPDRAFT_669002 [Peniophora sp. CONT]